MGEVDTLDGFLLVISPWVVHNIRFDESLGMLLHGYDFDFCLQVRDAGRKVVTSDFRAVHHHSPPYPGPRLSHWRRVYAHPVGRPVRLHRHAAPHSCEMPQGSLATVENKV